MLVLGSVKKCRFCFFQENSKIFHFWAQFGPFLLKCPKTEVFCIFLKTAHWNFLIFCMNASLRDCKKETFLFFSGKLENWTFWAESVKNWHFSGFLGVPRNGCFSLSLRCVAHASQITLQYHEHTLSRSIKMNRLMLYVSIL